MSYRQAENIAIKLFAIAMLVFAVVHTYGVVRAVNARIQSTFTALER